jgi:hypothetical protein
MPEEEALNKYIELHNLAPEIAANASCVPRIEVSKAAARAKM